MRWRVALPEEDVEVGPVEGLADEGSIGLVDGGHPGPGLRGVLPELHVPGDQPSAAGVVTWFAAKIFKVGLLMHGKAPNMSTLIRWARAA